jgi:heterodisulfide reductase subunit A
MQDAGSKDVVVVGAGVAGYKAAQDLAQLGLEVLLVEGRPHAGGALDQHDRWFPTDDCSWCKTLPLFGGDAVPERCLRRQLDQPGIELYPATRVRRVAGERGAFTVTLEREADIVDPTLCTACNRCAEVCPASAADDFEEGTKQRRAAYIRHPWAVPGRYAIDLRACIHCGKCEPVCPTKAIDFKREGAAKEVAVSAKAVILSPGFANFDPATLRQYRFGAHPDVYTNAGFERVLSGAKDPVRRSDGKPIKSVAILHCIGSRDEERDFCSSACCLIAVKEALMLKELDPSIQVTLFYMDMRDQTRDGHAYFRKALALGVKVVRARPSSIQVGPQGQLVVEYADEVEGIKADTFDAVVLQVAQAPPPGLRELAEAAGVELDRHGFIARRPGTATWTSRDGVFVAGSAGGPKDIADTVSEAAAAAMEAALVAGVREAQATAPDACPAIGKPAATAVLMCKCHGEVGKALDIGQVLSFARTLPHVVSAEAVDLLCKGGGIAKALEGKGANRLVIAACPSYQWGRAAIEEAARAGIQRDLVDLIDVREWLAWANPAGPNATAKAQSLIAMSSERVRTAVPRAPTSVPVARPARALVIGGGLAGMTAALDLAGTGFGADLVERADKLGGHFANVSSTARGADAKHLLAGTVAGVTSSKAIEVFKRTELVSVDGAVGAFRARLKDAVTGETKTRVYGSIILATGAEKHGPKEHGLGSIDGVMDQLSFAALLDGPEGAKPRRIVMVQCVGSREEGGLPYCSRLCCTQAIRNARALLKRAPGSSVVVLNRDITTYGTLEGEFTAARDEGVRFLRFAEAAKPVVARGEGGLTVTVHDPGLGETLQLTADAVVLSTGVAARDVRGLAAMLRTEVDLHGFVKVPSGKFRPVDGFRDGVYACGLATGPKVAEESLTSAHAAAARAVTVLRRQALPARVGISTVNLRSCSACGLCVSQCPFQARYLDPKDGKARVDEAACWGCGVCAQVCPNHAASIATRTERQAMHQVDAATWT